MSESETTAEPAGAAFVAACGEVIRVAREMRARMLDDHSVGYEFGLRAGKIFFDAGAPRDEAKLATRRILAAVLTEPQA